MISFFKELIEMLVVAIVLLLLLIAHPAHGTISFSFSFDGTRHELILGSSR